MGKRLKEESGYSLIEVVVSIIILSLAILPMAGMFDMGLKGAAKGSNYDKSRALANFKIEEAKGVTFANLQNNFPVAGTAYNGSGTYVSGWMEDTGEPYWDDNYANFKYRVEKQYMRQPSKTPGSSTEDFLPCDQFSADPTIACSLGTGLIRVTVTVGWGTYEPVTDSYSNEFTTFGLVSA